MMWNHLLVFEYQEYIVNAVRTFDNVTFFSVSYGICNAYEMPWECNWMNIILWLNESFMETLKEN